MGELTRGCRETFPARRALDGLPAEGCDAEKLIHLNGSARGEARQMGIGCDPPVESSGNMRDAVPCAYHKVPVRLSVAVG
ncbi:hypothetical protein D9M71_272760 [compost metagenome]